MPRLVFAIRVGDILRFPADVLALKHAQAFYGVDRAVMLAMQESNAWPSAGLRLAPGSTQALETGGAISARLALFIGTPTVSHLEYEDIERFGREAVVAVGRLEGSPRHLAMPTHGAGFGLDEVEAFLAQFSGALAAIRFGSAPMVETISIVNSEGKHVERFGRALGERLEGDPDWKVKRDGEAWQFMLRGEGSRTSERMSLVADAAVMQPRNAPHVFVAMPFDPVFEDTFVFGIADPVRGAGYLCERVDETAFTGDILERVRQRIEAAALVIADLTGSNANVYLEVGYAWGKERPTVLLVKEGETLGFDVRGQRTLRYTSIRHLRDMLADELTGLLSGAPWGKAAEVHIADAELPARARPGEGH